MINRLRTLSLTKTSYKKELNTIYQIAENDNYRNDTIRNLI